MQTESLDQNGQVSVGREVSLSMCLAGCSAYDEWAGDAVEQNKSNAVANLVTRVFRAMAQVRDPRS